MHTLRTLPPSFLLPAWTNYQLYQFSNAYSSSGSLARQPSSTRRYSGDRHSTRLPPPLKLVRRVFLAKSKGDINTTQYVQSKTTAPTESNTSPDQKRAPTQANRKDASGRSSLKESSSTHGQEAEARKKFMPLWFRKLPSQPKSQSKLEISQGAARCDVNSTTTQTLPLREVRAGGSARDFFGAGRGEQKKVGSDAGSTSCKWSQGTETRRAGVVNEESKTQGRQSDQSSSSQFRGRPWSTAVSWDTGRSAVGSEKPASQTREPSHELSLPSEKRPVPVTNQGPGIRKLPLDGRMNFVGRYPETKPDTTRPEPTLTDASLNADSGQPKLTLLEELFPAEAKKAKRMLASLAQKQGAFKKEIARLDPPEFDDLQDTGTDLENENEAQSWLTAQSASQASMRADNLTILVHYGASPDLVDADYQRVTPRGAHIEEWKGPGDIVKVIPSRDADSLLPLNRYYLLFSNPAFARAFQNRAMHLHRLASAHTPTSMVSPIFPAPGTMHDGEDIHVLLKNYTVAPPSQALFLRALFPPYTSSIRRILAANGFPNLTQPVDRSGRSVLFWVDGFQPSTISVKNMLVRNGQDRGISWAPATGKGSITLLEKAPRKAQTGSNGGGDQALKKKPSFSRWVISFEDETEARRFVRAWHMKPYPLTDDGAQIADGEPEPLVYAKFLW